MNESSALAAAIRRHAPGDGVHPTPIPGLTLYAHRTPMARTPGIVAVSRNGT